MPTPSADYCGGVLRYALCMTDLADLRLAADEAVATLYQEIRRAKRSGVPYSQLERVTGLPRGTLQNICAGRSPGFTPWR